MVQVKNIKTLRIQQETVKFNRRTREDGIKLLHTDFINSTPFEFGRLNSE